VNVRHACLAALLSSTLLPPAVMAGTPPETAEAVPAVPERVLFIGNSHTARHGGLDWLIGNMVASEPSPRTYQGSALTEGGVTLEYHWQNGAVDRIRKGDFDAVVLQDYLAGSTTGTAEPFLEYTRLFEAVIRESGAKTVLFMTWPRRSNDWSTLEDVVAAHRLIADELDVAVAPAALAFERAHAERPDLELMEADGVHANWEGAYLAAATVYAALFDRSPEGLGYAFGIDPDTAQFLQRIAWESMLAWADGPDGAVTAPGDTGAG
jgi:hypothetical protein